MDLTIKVTPYLSHDPPRRNILLDRVVLAVDIATPQPQADSGRWHWQLAPPDVNDSSLRWYIDGSRRYT